MNIDDYKAYISAETMMGPDSVRILAELLHRYPLQAGPDDTILDLGCGTGLTSLVLAKETGAKIYANDLWISAEENEKRFAAWGVGGQVTPICEDANDLPFEKRQFHALVSIDSYHYFGGREGFFQEKILPFLKEDGVVLIGIPGLKEQYAGRADELLSDWLGEEARLFKSPGLWRKLIANGEGIASVKTWEMDCFNEAWEDWLSADNEFARGDRQYFETMIQPYTCFVGIYIRLKRTS
ncbi:MAG: methyltransferase domain-containing protein [Lachnospiraceae bacterium]|nr:methyltransferase domain-containing protein [Lachnospiraceae bacterium]